MFPSTSVSQACWTTKAKPGLFIQKFMNLKYLMKLLSERVHLITIGVWSDLVLSRCSISFMGKELVHSLLRNTLSNHFQILRPLPLPLHQVNLGPLKPSSTMPHYSMQEMISQLFSILCGTPPFFTPSSVITLKSPEIYQGPLIFWLHFLRLSHRDLNALFV